jgi:hypothetical protein
LPFFGGVFGSDTICTEFVMAGFFDALVIFAEQDINDISAAE